MSSSSSDDDDNILLTDSFVAQVYHYSLTHRHTQLCPFPFSIPCPIYDDLYTIRFQFKNNMLHTRCYAHSCVFTHNLIFDSILCRHLSILYIQNILENRHVQAIIPGIWTVSIVYPNFMPYEHQVRVYEDMCSVMDVVELVYAELGTLYRLDRSNSTEQLLVFKEPCSCETSFVAVDSSTVPSDHTCPICMCDFNSSSVYSRMTRCTHIYHTDCIQAWYDRSSTCPICRTTCTVCNGSKYMNVVKPIKCVLPRGNRTLHRYRFIVSNSEYRCFNIHMSNLVLECIQVDRVNRVIRPVFDTGSDHDTSAQLLDL